MVQKKIGSFGLIINSFKGNNCFKRQKFKDDYIALKNRLEALPTQLKYDITVNEAFTNKNKNLFCNRLHFDFEIKITRFPYQNWVSCKEN